MKTCCQCKADKAEDEFSLHKKYGRQSACKLCMKEYGKLYQAANKESLAERNREYRTINRVKIALGCSIPDFRKYLESRFQPGMDWSNWDRKGWHIDHVRPLASFDLTDPEQLKKACHFTNLQPLWAVDNLRKSDNVEQLEAKVDQ
jgi:hypothetical protein